MQSKLLIRDNIKSPSRHTYQLFLCSCGVLLKRRKSKVRTSISCSSCKEVKSKYQAINLLKTIYNRYQNGAWIRELSFDLDLHSFIELVLSKCVYCDAGLENTFKDSRGILKYNGIDRIDNNIGYRTGNTVSCCKTCNTAKMTKTPEEFFSWAQRVVTNGKRIKKLI